MKRLALLLVCGLALPSCTWVKETLMTPGDYTPEYLKEDSPLDPPGTADARRAERERLVKEGNYATGSTVDIQEGKAFLFKRNPDYTPGVTGRMVKAQQAKILSCEGLYYFVETDGGKRGFMRESDFVAPTKLVQTGLADPGAFPLEEGNVTNGSLLPAMEALPLEEAGPINPNQKLMTNESGRTVVIVSKKSDRSAEFEARKKAIMENPASLPPQPNSSTGSSEEPAYEPLPEPAAFSH